MNVLNAQRDKSEFKRLLRQLMFDRKRYRDALAHFRDGLREVETKEATVDRDAWLAWLSGILGEEN